jgi:hypothetical protein
MADFSFTPAAIAAGVSAVGKLTNTTTSAFKLTGVAPGGSTGSNVAPGTLAPLGYASTPTSNVTASQAQGANPLTANGASSAVWTPNILSSVDQPAYHIRFFITEDLTWDFNNYQTYTQFVADKINKAAQTTIAESGVTGINIQSLTMQAIAAPNNVTRSFSATSMTLVISEPMGVSFFDMVIQAAAELKIKNFSKFFYYLQISFKGYENGIPSGNVCPNSSNGGQWIYQVAVTDVAVDSNASGSVYTMTLMPYEEDSTFSADAMVLRDSFAPTGTTVGGVLKELSDQINQANFRDYGFQTQTFSFAITPVTSDSVIIDPGSWAITPAIVDFNSQRSMAMSTTEGTDQNVPIKGQFARGTKIHDVIELLFLNSKDGQKLAKDVNKQNEIDKTDGTPREPIIFRYEPRVENAGYDYYHEIYIQNITLDIKSYFTTRPIITHNDVEQYKDTTFQQTLVTKLREAGYLTKRYDYMFTGLNTEVLNFDFKFNFNWAAAIPRLAGYQNSYESTTMQAKDNPNKVRLDQIAKDAQNANAALDKDKATLNDLQQKQANLTQGNPVSSLSADQLTQYNATQKQITITQADANKLNGSINIIGNASSTIETIYNSQQASKLGNLPASRQATISYAEDMLDAQGAPRFPISIKQDGADPRNDASGPYPDQFTRDRSVYSAILNQMYGPVATSLVNITLEIKGDPYWLGDGNLERSLKNFLASKAQTPRSHLSKGAVSSTSVDFSYGDIMFLISFLYPLGLNPDGSPILNANGTFTGVYAVKSVTHTFSGGSFRQTLTSQRMERIDAFKALGYPEIRGIPTSVSASSTVSAQAQTVNATPPTQS